MSNIDVGVNQGMRTGGSSLTSPAHLGFGYDMYSCPGSFFAANEVKMILVYLLVSFDWEASAEGSKEDVYTCVGSLSDPDAKAIRSRNDRDVLL